MAGVEAGKANTVVNVWAGRKKAGHASRTEPVMGAYHWNSRITTRRIDIPPLYARSLGVSLYELSEDNGFCLLGLLIQSTVFLIETIASFCIIFWLKKSSTLWKNKL